MTLQTRVRCSMTAHPEPAAWHPPTPERPPYFCERCWRDFFDEIISAEDLLSTITHPMRSYTAWVCSRCCVTDYDDVPDYPASERLAALADIRAHIAMWSGRAATYERELSRDDF